MKKSIANPKTNVSVVMAERTKGSLSIPSPTSSRIARLSLADPESDRKACCCRVYGKAEQSSAQPHGAQHPSAGQSGRATEDAPTAAAPLAACSAAVVRPLYPSVLPPRRKSQPPLPAPLPAGAPQPPDTRAPTFRKRGRCSPP